MNAHSTIETPQAKRTNLEEFCRLRGRLVSLYAKLEQAIVGAIQRLDPKGKIPPMLSPRLKRFRSLLKEGGEQSFVDKIEKSLDALEEHVGRRNALVHADGNLAPSGEGSWRWVWHCARSEDGEQERGWWTAQELLDWEADLHSHIDRLCAHVRKVDGKK